MCYLSLLRRADADRDQRSVSRACLRTAGGPLFAEELGRIACRPAISGDQNLIVLALDRTSRRAVGLDDPGAGAGCALRTRWSGRTCRAGRSDRARGSGFAFGTLRPRRTRI